MEDKTPIYLLSILGIVVVIGAIIMLFNATNTTTPQIQGNAVYEDNLMTGNVAFETTSPNLNVFGKIFFMAFLVGVVTYMYFKVE